MQEPLSTSPTTPNARQVKHVFAITERDSRSHWTRIGQAWVNRDGSITVRLEALPVSGVLQLREPDERRDARGGAQ